MIQVNIYEIKAHFSKYLRQAAQGETIVVCKHNKPLVEIGPIGKPKLKKRILGSGKDSIKVSPDWQEPWPKSYTDLFYGDAKSGKDDPLFWKP